MIKTLPYKTKQFLVVLIKLSIVVAAFYFIYQRLTNNDTLEFQVFLDYLTNNLIFSAQNVLFLLILTSLNWMFEIFKWKTLVSSITNISFKNSLEQSLGALTASLFTPNRIGEYGAKAIYHQKRFRKKILLLNLIANMMQMSATILFGVVGLIFYIYSYQVELNLNKLILFLLLLCFVLGIVGYTFKKKQFKIKWFSLSKILKFIKRMPLKIKLQVFTFSITRYLIFSFQFYYLLLMFGVPMDYLHAMMAITSMYLFSSIVPSIFIFDVVIKGSVAVYLFSFIEVNDLTILCVVTLMWLFNFVIPSVFGSYYVLNFNLSKELKTL